MKYEKLGEFWLNKNENWTAQVQVMLFWTNMYTSWPQTFIVHFRLCQMCLPNQFSVHLNDPKIILLIHLRNDQELIFQL